MESQALVELLNKCLDRYEVPEKNIYRDREFTKKFVELLDDKEKHIVELMARYLMDEVDIQVNLLKDILSPFKMTMETYQNLLDDAMEVSLLQYQ